MESRIAIDIYETGEPYIALNFKPSDDLRDKVLGRFLTASGAYIKSGVHLPLTLWVVHNGSESGVITAHIEVPKEVQTDMQE